MSTDVKDRPAGYIDILDLKNPVLSDLQKQTLANAPEVTLDEETVLETARRETGLSDFGADDFRPRLRLWLQCAREDTELSRVGQAAIFGMSLRYAMNRLRMEDLIRRHPEILDIPIEKPLVIAGLPRSGTTHLQAFLAADPRLRSLHYWEALRPIPAPEEIAQPGQEDPRHARCAAEWDATDRLLPYRKASHEMSPDHISEDVELQGIDFGSYHIEWLMFAPRWRDHCAATDQTPIYRYLKKGLQVLDFLTGRKERWLLKCPQHMEYLVPLTTVFPDATVMITHRDPVGSIQSAITGNCYRQRVTRTRVDTDLTRDYWIDRYERLLRACVRDRDKLDDSRVHDILFHELMADPMAQVEAIYAKAGLSLPPEIRARMEVFLADNPRGKHGQLRYDLKRDFGVTPEEVRDRFGFYFDRFPVKKEVK